MTPAPAGGARPVSHRITKEAFYRAVVAAGRAPSAFNAQPWRWRVTDGVTPLSWPAPSITGGPTHVR